MALRSAASCNFFRHLVEPRHACKRGLVFLPGSSTEESPCLLTAAFQAEMVFRNVFTKFEARTALDAYQGLQLCSNLCKHYVCFG